MSVWGIKDLTSRQSKDHVLSSLQAIKDHVCSAPCFQVQQNSGAEKAASSQGRWVTENQKMSTGWSKCQETQQSNVKRKVKMSEKHCAATAQPLYSHWGLQCLLVFAVSSSCKSRKKKQATGKVNKNVNVGGFPHCMHPDMLFCLFSRPFDAKQKSYM